LKKLIIYDIAIVGAGASGLMTASFINSYKNKSICLIDKNPTIGQKLKISGGSKCNITNKYLNTNKYLGNKNFIDTIISNFNNNDLLQFLKKNNINPILKEKIVKGTYFCKNSLEIINFFNKEISSNKLFLNTEVIDVEYINNTYIITTKNNIIKTKKLIIASGGLSYPSLGATDIGYKIAEKFGHTIVSPKPALVGFTVQKEQFWFKQLSGLSLDEVHIKINNKLCKGSMLFTHKGCSGPVILSSSLYWEKGKISINFLPNKNSYLPKRFRQNIKDLKIDIHNYTFAPAGNFGYSKAEVTKGGINTNEINPQTMESVLQKDLYFIGEVLDVTGELGGYNLQWAFSSAKVIASNI
jgi:predicted Rossmann fold flavoprotein